MSDGNDINRQVFEQAKRNVVDTSKGTFEEHPESYHPRVFVELAEPLPSGQRCVELLADGKAVTWPTAPSYFANNTTVGFDFFVIRAERLSCVDTVRSR